MGLGDFRVRSYEAIDKYVVVVQLALAYTQWRLRHERSAQLESVADVIRLHRDEHTCDWLRGACQEASQTGDVEAVLSKYMRLAA